jgi:hypothetical protein
MNKDEYLSQLAECLAQNPDFKEILAEISNHIEEKQRELIVLGLEEDLALKAVLEDLGDPEFISSRFRKPMLKTPVATFRLFIWMNYLLIAFGLVLMVANSFFQNPFARGIWDQLVTLKWALLSLYTIFWGYIGFWMGENFGLNARTVVHHQVVVWIPNFILMFAVLYSSDISQWFIPLLTPAFVAASSIVTVFIMFVLRWGYKRGVAHL